MNALYEFLKKWWLPSISLLLASTPPSVALYFQSFLLPLISQVSPVAILWVCTMLLWLTLLLFAYIFINRQIFKWDETTGTWIDNKSGIRYCAKCKVKENPSPLKNENFGWKCLACKSYFPDPNRPTPVVEKPNYPDPFARHS